ncbi:multiheme c-type cytochrome [Bacillus salipaludis]|uniref:multiheme c-type cytochrome n=1 Tax=Bacillus salipaludis TaxID=2547811 RepID=UPI002E1BD192|nr:cytochrome c3 family protein [Bacillus salipaludis]
MKKTNWMNTGYFYSFLMTILVVSSIFSLPSSIVFSAAGDQPTITIDTPSTDAMINSSKIIISGTYTNTDETIPNSNLIFTAFDKVDTSDPDKKISDSTSNTGDWNITENGTWSFTTELQDGAYTLSIEVKATEAAKTSVTFLINTTRPYISGTAIVLSDSKEYNGEDLTSIPSNAKVKISITDDQPMTQLLKKIEDKANPYNPIQVMLGSQPPLEGQTIMREADAQTGKYQYDIIFKPKDVLVLNKTYRVAIDSALTDDAKNKVYRKFFKFTTKSDLDREDNPHGHYTLNTNMCAACHSTHIDSPEVLKSDREGGSYLLTFNDKVKSDPSMNYCMACHDGTLNAPIVDKISSTFHHNNPVEQSGTGKNLLSQAEACTSCHNPHLEWSDKNQNMLKDHYVYTHKDTSIGQNGLIDSLETSCGSCHKNYLVHDTSTNKEISIFNNLADDYKVLSYKKSLTSVGVSEDFSLCLRCHNGKRASDIKQYYEKNLDKSMHKLKAVDGSNLNGGIPCAECHETHGSSNQLLLKSKLGQEHRDQEAFTFNDGSWDAGKEKEFCLKCHNGKTAIYGVTGKAIYDDTGKALSSSHDTNDACSSCHGTGPDEKEKVISAAHAPRAVQSPKTVIENAVKGLTANTSTSKAFKATNTHK